MDSTELARGVVRLLSSSGEITGTGFLVRGGFVLTCSHVVRPGSGDTGGALPERVKLVFQVDGSEAEARVDHAAWRGIDEGDVAVLHLMNPAPSASLQLDFGFSDASLGHQFLTFGFPELGRISGILGQGTIMGKVSEGGIPLLQLRSDEVTRGFSGGPVWDWVTRRVVGMVVSITPPDSESRLSTTVFAITTEFLQACFPPLRLSEVCPYRSLEFFTEADAAFFFGRDIAVRELGRSLNEHGFVAVLGPSGSGKSSLVRAGLVPYLKAGGISGSRSWRIIVSRPGEQPFEQLHQFGITRLPNEFVTVLEDRFLTQDAAKIVLILDQFEEIFIDCPRELRVSFLRQLAEAMDRFPIAVVLIMRDDFYSRFLQEAAPLVPRLERGLKNVPPQLHREQLLEIITRPAQAVGLRFEPSDLPERIVEDAINAAPVAYGDPGACQSTVLPLLEFALTELWEERLSGSLTAVSYGKLGKITAVLAGWADRAYLALDSDDRQSAQRLFMELVRLGDENVGIPDTRWRRTIADLQLPGEDPNLIERLVRHFVDRRLLVTGRDFNRGRETVEIIHEALIREWGLLRQWLLEDRQRLAWRQRLHQRAQDWHVTAPDDLGSRDVGRLLRGRDLTEAEHWLTVSPGSISSFEQEFLSASLQARADEEQAAEELRAVAYEAQRFVAVMSHEMRTPVNAILGYSALMLDQIYGPFSEGVERGLTRIQDAARHLLSLANDILSLSSVSAGKIVVDIMPVRIAQIVNEVVLMLDPLTKERRLSIDSFFGDLPEFSTDPDKLRTILLNLLSNAIKFTEEGSIEVTARCVDDHLEICVHDTGVGFEPEIAEQIFQPFWARDPSIHSRGLGLFISRSLARALGGDIIPSSIPGEGSTFVLRLPPKTAF